MASERVQRRIGSLLDEAEAAIKRLDWRVVHDRAEAGLAIDPENADALTYLASADRALGATRASPPSPQPAETTATERSLAATSHAADAFFLHNQEGRIVDVNQTACDSLGYTRDELINLSISDINLLTPEELKQVGPSVGVVDRRAVIRRKDGTTFPVEVHLGGLEWQGRRLVFSLVRDITEHQQADEALRASEERFRSLWDHAADGFFLCELSGKIVDVNQMACDISGHTREELLDLSVSDITPVSPVGAATEWRELVPGVPIADRGVIRRKDGTVFPVEVHFTALESQGRKLILGSILDITETKQAEETQRELAVLEERNRLARELHDSVTQSLYSLTLFAEAGRRQAESGEWERVTSYLSQLGETSQQALKEMRLLVYELLPLDLEKEGLIGALQQRLDAVEGRSGVEARLIVEGDVSLQPHLEACLYRVALEALNNSLKHAAATQVTVRVVADGQRVALDIEDNGKGFDQKALPDRGGMALASMRERTDEVGGTLVILSEPGKGTAVKLAVVASV